MPPRYWADEEQLAFLRSQRNEFLEAQKMKSLTKFWNGLDRLWFEKWPEAGTDAEVSAEEVEKHMQEFGQRIEKRKKVEFLTSVPLSCIHPHYYFSN